MHYLDNAATTKPAEAAVRAALSCMEDDFANPSSLHAAGRAARARLETARRQVAAALGAASGEIVFTAGGTESVNLALMGAASARRRKGRHIVTAALEHPAVAETAKRLQALDFSVTAVPPEEGRISAGAVLAAVRPDTVLVSVGLVCGETGAFGPVADVAAVLKRERPEILVHTDAVQGFCKTDCRPNTLGVGLMSISAHKIGGLKGAGALWKRPDIRLLPLSYGGGQENGLRHGTEPLPALCAFGAAAEGAAATWETDAAAMSALKERLITGLRALPRAVVIPAPDAPHIVSFALPGYPSEVMVRFLSDRGVFISAGTACHRGKKSAALTALGLPGPVSGGALRASFCPQNTAGDVDALLAALGAARDELSLG